VENVTDRTSNPFGMRPPCETPCTPGSVAAVYGYGDANADVHGVGDYPGRHGGRTPGVPFTETVAAGRLQSVLHEVGLFAAPYSDEPAVRNLFLSYLHMCCTPDDRRPTAAEYADMERFFDAELRAITADVIVPVGQRAVEHVLRSYTSQAHRHELDHRALHATELHGSGFLVVPLADPTGWDDDDRADAVERLRAVLDSNYQQLSDLGRFRPGGESYLVR